MQTERNIRVAAILLLLLFINIFSSVVAWEDEGSGEIHVISYAQITSYSISPGEFKVREKVSASVTIKNIGDTKWTFYVNFSVQDPNKNWWNAPYETITLDQGASGTVTLYWVVDASAPPGSYNARVAVWKSKTDNILVERLDYKEQSNAFKVKVPYQLYGYVKYLDENGNDVPLEGVLVEVQWGTWPFSKSKNTTTNDEGFYWFNDLDPKYTYTIKVSLTDGKYIKVIDGEGIIASSVGELISFIFKGILKPISKTLKNIKLERYSYQVPDIIFSSGNEDEGATVFVNTLKAVRFYTKRLQVILSEVIPIVIYSDFETAYRPPFKIITIHKDDSSKNSPNAPDNREWHEFSHYIMHTIYGSMPPYHHVDLNDDGDTEDPGEEDHNHGGYRNHCTSDSWVEGFAVFMPLVIKSEMGMGDVSWYKWDYYDPKMKKYGTDLEQDLLAINLEELVVARILWDLYDGKHTHDQSVGKDDDSISLSIDVIWKLISKKHMLLPYYQNGMLIENEDKIERYVYYVSDLYQIFSSYDVTLDGILDEKDAELVREIFESRYGFVIVEGHIYFEDIPTRR
jgi:hypothetical protein